MEHCLYYCDGAPCIALHALLQIRGANATC